VGADEATKCSEPPAFEKDIDGQARGKNYAYASLVLVEPLQKWSSRNICKRAN
jgi:hypothetical protein